MKYYTETIPISLAEKLKEKGMPITMSNHLYQVAPDVRGLVKANFKELDCPTYAEVFDWLMGKGWFAAIGREYDFANELVTERFEWGLEKVGCFSNHPEDGYGFCDSWHEAANAAIETALELIKEN